MLSKDTLDALAVISGIKADELAQAISDEQEKKLELPKGRFLTPEQEESVIDAHGKKRYDAGVAKATKDAFDGKSKDEFIEGLKSSILDEAKLEPNQKLTEKEKAIELLQNSLKEKETEIERIRRESLEAQRKAQALAKIPTLRDDLGLQKEEALNLILSGVEIKEDGLYKGDAPIVDEYQRPIPLEGFIESEVNKRGWTVQKPAGHGGKQGKQTLGTPKSYTEFQKYCENKGWAEGSLEAKQYLKTVRAKNPEFEI